MYIHTNIYIVYESRRLQDCCSRPNINWYFPKQISSNRILMNLKYRLLLNYLFLWSGLMTAHFLRIESWYISTTDYCCYCEITRSCGVDAPPQSFGQLAFLSNIWTALFGLFSKEKLEKLSPYFQSQDNFLRCFKWGFRAVGFLWGKH